MTYNNHMNKKRILTGDRPTGRLHLGHYVGSLKNRISLQDEYECFFIIADLHTLTTQPEKTGELEANVRDLVLDYLSVGIDPTKSTIYLQSQIPEVTELAVIFSNLVSVPRMQRVPTLKDVMRDADIKIPSLGLLGYPVLQAADILMVKADLVPVGRDQVSHIEVTREIVREFNRLYPLDSARGPVSSFPPASARSRWKSNDDQVDNVNLRAVGDPSSAATPRTNAGVFPIPEALIPADIGTLPGTDGRAKMSKSAGNVINLSDDSQTVEKKVMAMYTDPKRIHGDEPGQIEGNPVFVYHDAFNSNKKEVEELKKRYKKGKIGDVEVKEKLASALNKFLAPIRLKRKKFEKQKDLIGKILKQGTEKARREAQETLSLAKAAMRMDYLS